MSNVLKHYGYLHTIPEVGLEEVKTSAYLAEQLEQAGFKVTRNVGGATGVIGVSAFMIVAWKDLPWLFVPTWMLSAM